ncbi:MAG: RNA polymerase sigma factor [Daejeonella sp.]
MNRTSKVKLSEPDLISALRKQEKIAIEALYDMYSPALYGVIHRIIDNEEIAEDVLQDTFVKIWNSFSSYDASKGRLFTWMVNLARNLAIDKVRSKDYRNHTKNHDIDNFVNTIDDKQSSIFNTDAVGIREMVEKLLPDQRSILQLIYFQGYTQAEAAEKLNIPLGTLKTRTRAAILTMRKFFQEP